jgi:hypothetical protein
MSDFADYVNGKTIAIVGPAPAPYDQSDEVNAHDLVYRTSYGFSAPADKSIRRSSSTDLGTNWYVSGVVPAGYGDRTDMAFYNVGAGIQAARGELDQVLADLDWAVFKIDVMPPSPVTNIRPCNRPPVAQPGTESQVTAMLWDLTFFKPAKVTVFGADFYTGPIESWYDPAYAPTEAIVDGTEIVSSVESIRWHDQENNRSIVRLVRALGWLAGDDRYLRALDMTFEEHQAILDEQLNRAYREHVY